MNFVFFFFTKLIKRNYNEEIMPRSLSTHLLQEESEVLWAECREEWKLCTSKTKTITQR
jgi:hypothetical protein